MPTWGLILERNIGEHRGLTWSVGVLGHVEGTGEEALAALRERVDAFDPGLFRKVVRRVVYREGDGFLVVVEPRFGLPHHYRFKAVEVVSDSAPPPPEPEPLPEPRPEPVPVPRRGHPVPPPPPPPKAWDADVPDRPAWLGRDDLA
ncbi:hypothetical protein AB4039_30310 [Streptomyces sp. M-16]|uniref:hypothetical protein n=1 Tax=Streptomyces sp. M-16 TaxID=3233040 RepID=UPI002255A368